MLNQDYSMHISIHLAFSDLPEFYVNSLEVKLAVSFLIGLI
jgi:hypothetical protein